MEKRPRVVAVTTMASGAATRSRPARPTPQWDRSSRHGGLVFALRQIFSTDSAEFYSIIDDALRSFNAKKLQYSYGRYAQWIVTNVGERHCFSGVLQALKNSNITNHIQLMHSMSTPQSHKWDRFGSLILTFPRVTSKKYIRKYLPVTLTINDDDFQHLLTGGVEVSHLCNWGNCINPLHLTPESHRDNVNRSNECFKFAVQRAELGEEVDEYCTRHTPPCLLRCAAIPVTSKVLGEHVIIHGTLPDALPSQIKSVQGPGLLLGPVRLYEWRNGLRETLREYPEPSTIVHEDDNSQPESTHTSGVPFRLGVQDFLTGLDV